MPKQHATPIQIASILKHLEDHCEKKGDRAEYEDGWDDRTIANEVGCSIASVARFRRELYGNVASAPVANGKYATKEELEFLKKGIRLLIAKLKKNKSTFTNKHRGELNAIIDQGFFGSGSELTTDD